MIKYPEPIIKFFFLDEKNKNKKPVLVGSEGESMWQSTDYVGNYFMPLGEHGLHAHPMCKDEFLKACLVWNGDYIMTIKKKNLGVMTTQRELKATQIRNIQDGFDSNKATFLNVTPFMEKGEIYFALSDGQHSCLGNLEKEELNCKLSIGLDPLEAPADLNDKNTSEPWNTHNEFFSKIIPLRRDRSKKDDLGIRATYEILTRLGYDVQDKRYDNETSTNLGREAPHIWSMAVKATKLFPWRNQNIRQDFIDLDPRIRAKPYQQVINDAISVTKMVVGDDLTKGNRGNLFMAALMQIMSQRTDKWGPFEYDIKAIKRAVQKGSWRMYQGHSMEKNPLRTHNDYVGAAVERITQDGKTGGNGRIESQQNRVTALAHILCDMIIMEMEPKQNEFPSLDFSPKKASSPPT